MCPHEDICELRCQQSHLTQNQYVIMDTCFFIIGVICSIVSICVFCCLIYGLYIGENGKKISSCWYKIPTVVSSVFYCGISINYVLISLSKEIDTIFTNTNNVSGYFFTIFCLFILCIIIAKLSIYISILSRLYLTFADSIYYLRKSILNLMICVLFLFLLCGIYIDTLLYTKYRLNNPPSNYYIQFEVVFISLIIYDFISSVVMLLLFISKLYQVIFERRRTMISSLHLKETETLNLDENDMKFINAVTRYTILSTFQIITSQFGLLSLILLGFYVDYFQAKGGIKVRRWKEMYQFFFGFVAFDILINTITLILYYEFTRNIYFKCCNCVHKCCKRCFIWNADRITKKQISYYQINRSTV